MEGWTDGRTDRRMEIHPCVLQDIGPLGPLPKKKERKKERKKESKKGRHSERMRNKKKKRLREEKN